jgi:transcriptional regulator with XRE-family HTH domain
VLTIQDDMANLRLFAARLRQLRINYGASIGQFNLSARQFARILGIEAQRYRRYERAEIEPPLAVLALLRKVTGASLDRLVTGLPPGKADMMTQHGEPELASQVLADRLRMVREAANHQVKEVADLMKLDVENWARWEADLDTPPIDKIVEFAARFSVTVQFLTDGDLEGLRTEIRQMLLEKFPELGHNPGEHSAAADREKHTA